MSKIARGNKVSITLNVILILFLIGYFLFPYLEISFMKKTFSSCCYVIKAFQGNEYLPKWCDEFLTQKPEPAPPVNENENVNAPVNNNTNQPVGLANPAAIKCEEDGGTLEKYMTEGGEAALCVFSDGTICNEWDYFRGDCLPGECFRSCEKIDTENEGWYNSCTGDLLSLERCMGRESDWDKEEPLSDHEDEVAAVPDIKVSSPISNQQLSSPLKVEGQARVWENDVYVRVKSKDGRVLIEEQTKAKSPDIGQWGDFEIEIEYEFDLTKEGFIEVYSLSAKDGSEINVVNIPVAF